MTEPKSLLKEPACTRCVRGGASDLAFELQGQPPRFFRMRWRAQAWMNRSAGARSRGNGSDGQGDRAGSGIFANLEKCANRWGRPNRSGVGRGFGDNVFANKNSNRHRGDRRLEEKIPHGLETTRLPDRSTNSPTSKTGSSSCGPRADRFRGKARLWQRCRSHQPATSSPSVITDRRRRSSTSIRPNNRRQSRLANRHRQRIRSKTHSSPLGCGQDPDVILVAKFANSTTPHRHHSSGNRSPRLRHRPPHRTVRRVIERITPACSRPEKQSGVRRQLALVLKAFWPSTLIGSRLTGRGRTDQKRHAEESHVGCWASESCESNSADRHLIAVGKSASESILNRIRFGIRNEELDQDLPD